MEGPPPVAAETDLAEVSSALTVAVGRVARRLRQGHAAGELTLSELSVLSRLDRAGSLPAGLLAELERMSPQAMSVIVGVLEGQGLVARDVDATDSRRFILSPMPAGQRLLAGRRSLNARRVAGALGATLTPDEQRRLVEVIPLLDRLADGL